jgi:hypothetical protein
MNNNDEALIWHELNKKVILNTKIFSVSESECKTGSGKKAVFSLVQSR